MRVKRDITSLIVFTFIGLLAVYHDISMSFDSAVKSAGDCEQSEEHTVVYGITYGITPVEGPDSWTYLFNGQARSTLFGAYHGNLPLFRPVTFRVSSVDSF